jgi:plastocyanin
MSALSLFRPRPRRLAAAAVLALFLFPVVLPLASAAEPRTHVVTIRNMQFQPQTLEISPGDSVTWVNEDIYLHAVKSTDPAQPWQSRDLAPHASWTTTLTAAVSYVCPYHPTMIGKITLRAPATK